MSVLAFGGERVGLGLPQHASRQPTKARGPAQRPVRDANTLDEVRAQLGEAAIHKAIAEAIAKRDGDDGNTPVNPDIRADAALYDDGVGGHFERSVFLDPARRASGRGGGADGAPQVRVAPPPILA